MKKKNTGQKIGLTFIALLVTFSFAATAYAHGVVITYNLKANGEVELYAEFDTGEPMAEAQVTIYSPEDPMTPWLTGTADAEGRYLFVIDPEMPGIWDIQYRKAGHGDMVHIQLEAGMIDPALMDHAPGELLPDAPPTAETESLPETEAAAANAPEKETPAVGEEENGADDPEISGNETEAGLAELGLGKAETEIEAKESVAEAMEPERPPVNEAETAVEPTAATQAEPAPEVDAAETEIVAQAAPKPVNSPEETGEVAVLSSGGNTATTGGFTSLQILLMSVSVIWGFVGTALYFSGKRTQDHNHTHDHYH